jgi:two-component system cell cycle response regulator
MADEKRFIPRRRVLKSGKIIFNDGASVVDCVIRNLNVTGARLDVPTTVGVPDEFTLLDVHSGKSYPAKIAWRHGASMGVELDDPPADADADEDEDAQEND